MIDKWLYNFLKIDELFDQSRKFEIKLIILWIFKESGGFFANE